jgi:hypothetical protein
MWWGLTASALQLQGLQLAHLLQLACDLQAKDKSWSGSKCWQGHGLHIIEADASAN